MHMLVKETANVLVGNGVEAVAVEEAKHSAESKPQPARPSGRLDSRRPDVAASPSRCVDRRRCSLDVLPSRLAHGTGGEESVGRERFLF